MNDYKYINSPLFVINVLRFVFWIVIFFKFDKAQHIIIWVLAETLANILVAQGEYYKFRHVLWFIFKALTACSQFLSIVIYVILIIFYDYDEFEEVIFSIIKSLSFLSFMILIHLHNIYIIMKSYTMCFVLFFGLLFFVYLLKLSILFF